MTTFNQTNTNIGVQQNAEQIVNGALPTPTTMPEAAVQIAASRVDLSKIDTVPETTRAEADQHLAAAEAAAKATPQDKTTITQHLDRAKSTLESVTGLTGAALKVVGSVAAIATAIAGFVV